jgi:hypothetical protein
MEIHPLEYHRSNNNNNTSTNYCRSASLNMHHQYRGETVVATPLHHQYHGHWSQPLCNSTTVNSSSNSNKKRDFHFQVSITYYYSHFAKKLHLLAKCPPMLIIG